MIFIRKTNKNHVLFIIVLDVSPVKRSNIPNTKKEKGFAFLFFMLIIHYKSIFTFSDWVFAFSIFSGSSFPGFFCSMLSLS